MTLLDHSHYSIALMTLPEVEMAVDWARREGWNPGLSDPAVFYATDPTGFWMGRYKGQPVASLSAVKYGTSFAFIGLYIVVPDFRGHGLGLKLWDAGLASLAGRQVGLDGVVAQQDNYKKSGFQLAHRNIRFAGTARPHASKWALTMPQVVAVHEIDFQVLEANDRLFFPAARSVFLKHWTAPHHTQTLVFMEQKQVRGYGTVRACDRGFKIGPLNADSSEVAFALLAALTAHLPAEAEVFLDVPEPNQNAIALAEKWGMTAVFETARMYTQQAPSLPLNKIFGITSFELG